MPRVDLKSERACDYKLRMSTTLRSKVERSARKAKRSANKEMVARLESTFDERDSIAELKAIMAKVTAMAAANELNATLVSRLEASLSQRNAMIKAVHQLLTALDKKLPREIIDAPEVQAALEQLNGAMGTPAPKQREPALTE